jgi:hypothetical protein
MVEQDEWVFFRDIDWEDEKFNVFSVDTRDFHCGYRFEKDRWTSIKYDMSDFPPYVIRPRRNGEDPQVNQDLTHVTSQTGSGFNSYCRDDVMRLGRSSTPSSVVLNCRLPLGNLYFDEKTLRAVISNYDIYEPYTAVGRCTNF